LIVCLQETKLQNIDLFKAKSFLPSNLASSYVCAPADGTRGGILTAWDPVLFSLQNFFLKPHTLTTSLVCNATNLDFSITNAYGPSDHSGSLPFLRNLVDLLPLIPGPWILLGDFNLVRCAADKNNGQISNALCAAFNDTIQDLNISEVDLSDRLYTWTNKQPNPILARLDHVFTNSSLDSAFPFFNLSSLPRPTSDHTPLLLTLSTDLPKASFFRFENFWLLNLESHSRLLFLASENFGIEDDYIWITI
jgi:exonuclease III